MSLAWDMRTAVVDPGLLASKQFQDYLATLQRTVPSSPPLVVTDFGAAGNGLRDDTAAFQSAMKQAVSNGGGVVLVPPGTYMVSTFDKPTGMEPVTLAGFGDSSVIQRRGDIASGKGMVNVIGSNLLLESLLLNGSVTAPVGLFYNQDFTGVGLNDPMADSLTRNSSVWVHGGANGFTARRVKFQHTGGYAVLFDARAGAIADVNIDSCLFMNNRPNLFGVPGGQAIYGSWTGGIFCSGDGRAANPGRVVKRFLMTGCRFLRNTGNCLWQHLLGLDELHEDFQVVNCFFQDIGLDGILMGGVRGGSVNGNTLHRIGYTTLTDTDRSTPRWLANLNATAIDSSGLVIGVNYQGNSIISVNGGGLDLDGHADSSLSGNLVQVPNPGEVGYDEDQIAISGYGNAGSTSYGVNLGNTADNPQGGKNVAVVSNTLLGLASGSVRLYSARNCLVEANNIVVPNVPKAPPVAMGPGGPGLNQRSTGNVIKHNRFQYSPPMSGPFVFEDPSVGPFVAADRNYVFGNSPIIGNGLAVEFQKDPNSGSPTYLPTVWFT